MKTEYVPFTTDMIPEAGRLLAERHKRNRRSLPYLPERFEDQQVSTRAIEALWKEKLKNGFAAFRSGKLVGYLIGEMTTAPWGRSGTVYLPGYALAEGEGPVVLQDLYALLGEEWVKKGNFNHYLYISAAEKDVISALFDLGFGKQRVDALLDLRSIETPNVKRPKGVTIRKAGKGDNAHLGSMSNIIFRALGDAPYWHPTFPEDWEDLREGWAELADDKEWTVWMALDDKDDVLSTIGFRPELEADTQMLASPQTYYLSVAATKPHASGRGINTALAWYGLEQACKEGFDICYTNWISPNLLASRFWPRFGFQDVAYRLAKSVSPMIAWARAE